MEQYQQEQEVSMSEQRSTRIFRFVLLTLMVLTSLFTLRGTPALPLDIIRSEIFTIGILSCLLVWIIMRLIDGQFLLPPTSFLLAISAVSFATLLSAFFSPVTKVSFFGQGYETNTALFVLLFFILLICCTLYFSTKASIDKFLKLGFAVFIFLALLQVIKLFFPVTLFGLGASTETFFGKWNDFALYAAVVLVFCTTFFEFGITSLRAKVGCIGLMLLSLITLVATNLNLLWWTLGITMFILYFYRFYYERKRIGSSFSPEGIGPTVTRTPSFSSRLFRPSLLFLLISASFIVFGASNTIGEPNAFSSVIEKQFPKQLEVRPWKSTLDVYQQSISDSLLFGVGPNRFSNAWVRAKPPEVNDTLFWNIDFNTGIGHIPTAMTTSGIIGSLAWLFLLCVMGWFILRALFLHILPEPRAQGLRVAFALSTLVSFIMLAIYIPGTGGLLLVASVTGVFIGLLSLDGVLCPPKLISTTNRSISAFTSVLILLLFGIGTIVGIYHEVQRFRSLESFAQGVRVFNQSGATEKSLPLIKHAVAVAPLDLFYRELAAEHLAELQALLNQKTTLTPDILRERFGEVYQNALLASKHALDYDPTNYQNWLTRAGVFEAGVPAGVTNAETQARTAYNEALARNPKSPLVYYTMARLEVATNNSAKAREYLAQGLTLKSDYGDALYLLASLDAQAGDTKKALAELNIIARSNPNNPTLLFQIGYLEYTLKDYAAAEVSFATAIAANRNFANAKYFLGLTYAYEGKISPAITQFEELALLDPTNTVVPKIIDNLKNGHSALFGLDVSSGTLPALAN